MYVSIMDVYIYILTLRSMRMSNIDSFKPMCKIKQQVEFRVLETVFTKGKMKLAFQINEGHSASKTAPKIPQVNCQVFW
jgi:hypothetical protein